MKIHLSESVRDFAEQIAELQSILPFELTEDGGVLLEGEKAECLHVCRRGERAVISYQKPCQFFRGFFLLLQKGDDYEESFHPQFRRDGVMLDSAHNGVVSIPAIKEMIRYMALMGQNTMVINLEDVFAVEEQPYFGYLRGRYTAEEIREIDAYAVGYGVEIIPCIQTLAHLEMLLKWKTYEDYTDIDDILLVGDQRTYTLIEDVIRTCKKLFSTNQIHIGMDEAFRLGYGRYRERYGIADKFDILCRHLERVLDICKKYGLQPMMWSDMFFRAAFGGEYYAPENEIAPEFLQRVPRDVGLVYWDYYTTEKENYDKLFSQHLKFGNEILFADGAWRWTGFTSSLRHSYRVSALAVASAAEHGVDQMFTTLWAGGECTVFVALAVMALHAQYNYHGRLCEDAVNRELELLCGLSLEELFLLDLPNRNSLDDGDPSKNPSKYLFYQDVLLGSFEAHVAQDFPEFYEACAERLAQTAEKKGNRLDYFYRQLAALCRADAVKCRLALTLRKAYQSGDRETLKEIAEHTLPRLQELTEEFAGLFRTAYYRENKTIGFEVHQLRMGAAMARIKEAQLRITEYLDGKVSVIEELCGQPLPWDCGDTETMRNLHCDNWNIVVTSNYLYRC